MNSQFKKKFKNPENRQSTPPPFLGTEAWSASQSGYENGLESYPNPIVVLFCSRGCAKELQSPASEAGLKQHHDNRHDCDSEFELHGFYGDQPRHPRPLYRLMVLIP